jgi:excisionase family DNA binding protein
MRVDSHTITSLPTLLTPQETSEVLRISIAGIYRLVEKRELPFYKVRRSLRFDSVDVMTYLNGRRVESIKETICYEHTKV